MSENKISLSTTQAGDILGKSGKTVTRWLKQYQLQPRKTGGKYRIDPDTLEVLKTISEMSGERSQDTIRRVIGSSGRFGNKPIPSQALDVRTEIRQALQDHNDLAQKYATAAYQVGQLEQQVKTVTEENDRLRSEKKAMEAQLQQAHTRIQVLETKQRPWSHLWAWLSGK